MTNFDIAPGMAYTPKVRKGSPFLPVFDLNERAEISTIALGRIVDVADSKLLKEIILLTYTELLSNFRKANYYEKVTPFYPLPIREGAFTVEALIQAYNEVYASVAEGETGSHFRPGGHIEDHDIWGLYDENTDDHNGQGSTVSDAPTTNDFNIRTLDGKVPDDNTVRARAMLKKKDEGQHIDGLVLTGMSASDQKEKIIEQEERYYIAYPDLNLEILGVADHVVIEAQACVEGISQIKINPRTRRSGVARIAPLKAYTMVNQGFDRETNQPGHQLMPAIRIGTDGSLALIGVGPEDGVKIEDASGPKVLTNIGVRLSVGANEKSPQVFFNGDLQ